MKKVKMTIYSILWPHSDKPIFSFVEMHEHGCVTVGKQEVELTEFEFTQTEVIQKMREAKLQQLQAQRDRIDNELRSL